MSNFKNKTMFLMLILSVPLILLPGAVSASNYPTPSVPNFTISVTDSSYDTPSTSSANGFTGEITTTEGAHVEMRTVTFRINNEKFSPYTAQDGSDTLAINYFYNVRFKGQYETDWRTLFNPYAGFLSMDYGAPYTVLSYNCGYSPTDGLNFKGVTIPVGATVEFQVEALIGYIHHIYTTPGDPWGKYAFEGQTSGWSSTQTITINDNSTPDTSPTPSSGIPDPSDLPSQDPTAMPNQPVSGDSVLWGLDWMGIAIVALLAAVVVLLVFVVVFLRRRA